MRVYNKIKLTLIFINIFCVVISFINPKLLFVLQIIGKLHPIIIHFSISILFFQLLIPILRNNSNHLYFSYYNKSNISLHFIWAFVFYILFNIYLIRTKFNIKLFSVVLIIILIICSHYGGIEHNGSSWWIW